MGARPGAPHGDIGDKNASASLSMPNSCGIDLSPTVGREQSGYRPAVVVSNNFAIAKTNAVYIAPITNTTRQFPLHVALDGRTAATGEILCEQVKAVDLAARRFIRVEEWAREDGGLHIAQALVVQVLRRHRRAPRGAARPARQPRRAAGGRVRQIPRAVELPNAVLK